MLIALGVAWFAATFAGRATRLLYSVGRIAGWLVEAALVYVVLAFPTGRLPGRPDRFLAGAAAVIVVVLYLPTALLADAYPIPGPPTSCHHGVPGQRVHDRRRQQAFVDDIVRPLREFLTAALFTAVTVRLGMRIHRATPLVRRTLAPVLAVAILRLAILAVGTVGPPGRAALADHRSLHVADRLDAAGPGRRLPGRSCALAVVHGRGDAAARDAAARSSATGRAAGGPRRRLRRPLARHRLLAR